jgi:hypothetical protein
MKQLHFAVYFFSLMLLGITNYSFSQSLIGTWNNTSGPSDPIRYCFSADSTVIVQFQTGTSTADYTTFSIANSDIRGISFGTNGVVSWKGIYTVSSSTLSIEGYWHTGLPAVSPPTVFSSAPTTFTRELTGINRNKTENLQQVFSLLSGISFTLTSDSYVSLKAFDLRGREAVTLMNNEILPAGTYTKRWNNSTTPNGVYMYCLRIGSSMVTIKALR